MPTLSTGSPSRGLAQAERFVLAVQRELLAQMSRNAEPGAVIPAFSHDTASAGTIGTLKALVAEMLPGGRPTIERVAPQLGMSVRTLQRRLRDWGHSFEAIVDDTRREAAIERLTAGATSITEIAFLLGYSDLSHFTRAFRRWTGMTPREFLRRQRQSDAGD